MFVIYINVNYFCVNFKTIVMKNKILHFNIDVPAFIKELQENATKEQSYVMRAPMETLKSKLAQIAKRASEINDPELNILMLETKLYEVEHSEIYNLIEKQKQLLNK